MKLISLQIPGIFTVIIGLLYLPANTLVVLTNNPRERASQPTPQSDGIQTKEDAGLPI